MYDFLKNLLSGFSNYWQKFINQLPLIIIAIAVFLIFWLIAKFGRRAGTKLYDGVKDKSRKEAILVIGRLTKVGILILGAVVSLSIAGVNLTALITGLGLASFALGFALKDFISNFLAGLIILIQRPFVIGDTIEIGTYKGTVETIETRFTIIKTEKGDRVIIPNGEFLSKAVVKKTGEELIASQKIFTIPKTDKEERKKKALEFIEKQGRITNDQYQKLTGVSDTQATRDLDELEKEGKIKQVGRTKDIYYTLLG